MLIKVARLDEITSYDPLKKAKNATFSGRPTFALKCRV